MILPALVLFLAAADPETQLRTALAAKTGQVKLPGGVIEISREIVLPSDAHDLNIQGAGTTIKAAATFRGRALIVMAAGKNIDLHDLSLDGNREAVQRPTGLPPSETMFSRFTQNNGILAEGVTGLEIGKVKAKGIAGFTILVNAGHGVKIHDIVGSSRVDLQACKLEYSIVSPK